MRSLEIETAMQQVIKLREDYRKDLKEIVTPIFKQISDGSKFRKRGELSKLGLIRVTQKYFEGEFIKFVNELTQLYFVDIKEEFETGDLIIKFEHERFDRVTEGSYTPKYIILIEDDNKTVRYLREDKKTTIEDNMEVFKEWQ